MFRDYYEAADVVSHFVSMVIVFAALLHCRLVGCGSVILPFHLLRLSCVPLPDRFLGIIQPNKNHVPI